MKNQLMRLKINYNVSTGNLLKEHTLHCVMSCLCVYSIKLTEIKLMPSKRLISVNDLESQIVEDAMMIDE